MGDSARIVLIVDDEPELAEIVSIEFELLGFEPKLAHNGREGLKYVQENPVDVILSDIRMPAGDGLTLLNEMMTTMERPPPLIFMSGFADLEIDQAFHDGAAALFPKPYDRDQLVAKVETILQPPTARWGTPVAKDIVLPKLAAESLAAAQSEGRLQLGRGGLFVRASGDEVRAGQKVEFEIRFAQGKPSCLVGVGTVRWARIEPNDSLPTGYGIEFDYLSDECCAEVAAYLSSTKIKPFIPRF